MPSVEVVKVRDGESKAVNVKDGFDSEEGVSARAKGFALMIEKFVDKVRDRLQCEAVRPTPALQLPDMDFPINAMAEGRILVPWEHRRYPNLTEGIGYHGLELCRQKLNYVQVLLRNN